MPPNTSLLVRANAAEPPLGGELRVPPDKSISHRVLLLAALAEGRSQLSNVLAGEDVHRTMQALRQLGVEIRVVSESAGGGAFDLEVEGVGGPGGLQSPAEPLDMGNSGTGMRLLAGLLCGGNLSATLIGDASLMRRPMARIVEPLRLMGAEIQCAADGCAPLQIRPASGPLRAIDYRLPVASAQIKSALLLAGLAADGETRVEEAAEARSRDHTEILLGAQGRARVTEGQTDGRSWYRTAVVGGGAPLQPLEIRVPADPSSAAFPLLAAALRPGSSLRLPEVCVNPTRAGFVAKFRQLGVRIELSNQRLHGGEPVADLQIEAAPLGRCEIAPDEVPSLIDEIPALALAGHFAAGGIGVEGAGELRHKETDRLGTVLSLLRRLGDPAARIRESGDGFCIEAGGPNPTMRGGTLDSGGDHRIAMAFAAVAPLAEDLRIDDCLCIATSFPNFSAAMRQIGVDLTEVPA